MEIGALIGAIGGVIGILGAVIAYTKFAAQAPLQARIAELEADLKRRQERDADLQGKYETLEARYDNLSRDFSNLKRGKSGVVIKNDIDAALLRGMNLLQATESSVLVPGPPPSSSFVFLSIYGRAAASLRYSKLPIDKGKAGKVFATGRLDNSSDARKDSEFFKEMDKKGAHTTRTMLTVPLRYGDGTIGVVQFLNKEDDRDFTDQDEAIATEIADGLVDKVADFIGETSNFELLGLSAEQKGKEETVIFCDLSASAELFRVLSAPDAIDCVNEYFERQSEIAMALGATVDKYMGDGIMLRFTPRNSEDREHAARAVTAAWQMNADFEALKQSWLNFEYAVEDVYSRIGLASGRVYQTILGHRQHKHITVIGDIVNTAANLCDIGDRTRQVILINAGAQKLIGEDFDVQELPADIQRRMKSGRGPFFEVVGVRDRALQLAGRQDARS
jgi:class 3 adenylate cyclase